MTSGAKHTNASTGAIKAAISRTLGVEVDRVVDDAGLVEDLGADSLDMAELAMALQEEFGVDLTDEQLLQIKTVKDVVRVLAGAGKAT